MNSGAAVSNTATGINTQGGGVYVGTGAQASVAGLSSNTVTGDNAKGGGAYNENVLTVTSNIQNNKALGINAQGGGIYNNNGTVNVNASNSALTISGNVAGAALASATSNAIYSNGGILNLNGTYGINLNDRIFSTASSVLNTTGTVNLNADSTGYVGAVNLNGGTVTLGNSGTFFNPTSTTVNADTIFDSRNSKIDTNSFGAFDINTGSTLYLKLDADLNTKTLDKITSTSGTTPIGSVIISEVKILTENQSTPPQTTFNIPFANVGLNAGITSSTIFSNNYKYQVSLNSDKESLDFLVKNVFSGLPEAVQYYHDIGQTNYPRFYATGDVDVTAWLNSQNGNVQQDSYIYINGQHYSISSSNGITGIDISTLRQMDIVDVGSWTTNANGAITINKAWSGFNAHRGGALDNLAGTLSINNSAFSNNTAVNEGGTISNVSTATLSVVNSLIANSQAGTKGGAIYNSGSDATITGTTLSSNTAGTSGGAIENINSTATITNSVISNNTAGTSGGAISNTGTTSSITGSTFANNQAGGNGGAIYNSNSPTTIFTSTFTQNRATGDGGAIYNANSATTIANSTISNNQAAGNGGAIYNNSNMTITDTSFLNNKTTGANTKGGAIYNSGTLTVTANNNDVNFSGNTVANSSQKNAIYMDGGSITLNTGAHSISFADSIMSKDNTSIMAINATGTDSNGDALGTVNISSDVSDYKGNLALNGATLNFTNALPNNTLLNLNGLTVSNNPLINTQNGRAQDANLGSATFNSDLRVRVDVNLQNKTMDRYLASSLTNPGNHNIIVEDLKILTPTTNWVTRINFVNSPLKDNVISNTVKVVYSPIYKYDLSYESQTGDYVFNYNGFSPNAYSGPVGALVGGYFNQLNTYDQVFTNLEMFMRLPKKDRLAIMHANKIASADTNSYNYLINHEETKGLWFRPYSTFEKVPLKNGPTVSNIGYGAFLGGDTEMVSLGHGFEGLLSLYAGYNGSHQNYDGVGINQNGGTLGLTETIYKGNFFGGLTINAGSSSGEASSMFGMDSFNMLSSGVGMRTGYNFEMKNGKYIFQPNLMMSYSYINTFAYTTATGVNITSTPLNVLHIEPGIRFIANLNDGWQPYLGVSVAGNVMGDTNFQANDVSLPDLSVTPYVKYMLGVQKNWGKKITGFAQTFVTNGGRNGIGFQLALRWTL